MIPNTWRDTPDTAITGPEADDDDDDQFRPVWEAEPDETDLLPAVSPLGAHAARGAAADLDKLGGLDLTVLLTPLCDAQDALARLDASAAAAPENIRAGLITRMGFREAAGWLAHAHAWVHPLDLSLRDLDLTGSYAVAATGCGARVMPHTFGADGSSTTSRSAWDEPCFDELASGDRAVADALALARLLRRLAGARTDPFSSAADAEATLAQFGAGVLDAGRFAQWQAAYQPTPVPPRRRFGSAGEERQRALPPLLVAALAAAAWMESGIADVPTPLQALLAAVALLARSGVAGAVFVPVWAAYPAAGFGDRDALPGLRSDVIDRLAGRGRGVAWPVVFLHMVAESARAGLRELDRLVGVAEKGRVLTTRCDKRSRLPDTIETLLRVPVLTSKALAGKLRVAPQTATALLRDLRAAGLVREVTGRGSFRAFAL